MSGTQRPVTGIARTAGRPADIPAWRSTPSWFAFGGGDLNIPAALHRFVADRAGAKGIHEVSGAFHALSASRAESVTASILEAVDAISAQPDPQCRPRQHRRDGIQQPK